MTVGDPKWLPPDPTEEDLARMRPDLEKLAGSVTRAVVAEAERVGRLPGIERTASIITEVVEGDVLLQELGENSIPVAYALALAAQLRLGVARHLADARHDGEGREG